MARYFLDSSALVKRYHQEAALQVELPLASLRNGLPAFGLAHLNCCNESLTHVHRRKISAAGGDSADCAVGFERAQFIVKGFLQGMHASPFHGFSVEFSEHRKYTPGDDPQDIDWLVYAKTDKYYIKKFEAETNITGYLVMDLSSSMGYTYRQELTKFEYGICLAALLSAI